MLRLFIATLLLVAILGIGFAHTLPFKEAISSGDGVVGYGFSTVTDVYTQRLRHATDEYWNDTCSNMPVAYCANAGPALKVTVVLP